MDDRTAKRTGYPLTIPDSLLHSDAMRRACLTRDFGEIFRLVNRRTGASYADIAAAIGKMTSSRISDVIRGVRRIRGQAVIERIADGFGIPGEMLDLPQRPWEGISPCESPQAPASRGNEVSFSSVIPERPESGGLSEMIRRDFLRLMSITNAVITAPDTFTCEEEGGSATARNTSAEAHERMNSHLWQVFSLSRSKRALQPVVREQLCELASSIRNTTSYREHRSLCAVAGSLFQLAGEIFFDSNHYAEAAHCYTLAAAASKEAEDFDLWACALTRHAFIGLYEREYGDTIPLLETAERIATRGDGQLSTRHWVAAVQAEVYARLGDYDACRRSLDKAEQVLSLGGGRTQRRVAALRWFEIGRGTRDLLCRPRQIRPGRGGPLGSAAPAPFCSPEGECPHRPGRHRSSTARHRQGFDLCPIGDRTWQADELGIRGA
jgi:transcriptional regulator with XRE-family HTH domain